MADQFRMATWLRHDFAAGDREPPYCKLASGQPLLLALDPKGIKVCDLNNAYVGFVAEAHTPAIRAKIEGGEILLSKVTGKCACVMRPILVWSGGHKDADVGMMDQVITRQITRNDPKPKIPEKV